MSYRHHGGFGGVKALRVVSVTKALAAAAGYGANDVLSEHATTGTDWNFDAVVPAVGGSGTIVKAHVISESESVVPALTLYLFTAAPTSVLDDNVANTAPDSADLANYIGKIDFPAMEALGTTDSNAIATPSLSTGNIPLRFKTGATTGLFGILVTRTAYTQTATDDMTVKLEIEPD